MTIPAGLTLAMDAQFRELSNFITPPRAGKITAIEGNGQVRVATDDPDGGDVLAWPLNGLRYAVDDVVYITFAVNNPESALVIGSKGSDPSGGPFIRKNGEDALTADWDIGEDRRIMLEAMSARDGEGLRFEDDAGNVSLAALDGGKLVVIGSNSYTQPYSGFAAQGNYAVVVRQPANINAGAPFSAFVFANNQSGTGHNIAQLMFVNEAIGGAEMRLAQIVVQTDGAIDHGRVILRTFDSGTGADVLTLLANGFAHFLSRVGIGTASPQGSLDIRTGSGGFLVTTKTGVDSSTQVIIPNEAGDVTKACHVTFVLSDGTSTIANSFVLMQGGAMSAALALGGSTWTVTLNANGQLSVARTAGSGTATIHFTITWM